MVLSIFIRLSTQQTKCPPFLKNMRLYNQITHFTLYFDLTRYLGVFQGKGKVKIEIIIVPYCLIAITS